MLSDWARWMLENKELEVVLGMADPGPGDIDSCMQAQKLVKDLKVNPARITLLLRDQDTFSNLAKAAGFLPDQANASHLALLHRRLKS
jgi:hypothetical protein